MSRRPIRSVAAAAGFCIVGHLSDSRTICGWISCTLFLHGIGEEQGGVHRGWRLAVRVQRRVSESVSSEHLVGCCEGLPLASLVLLPRYRRSITVAVVILSAAKDLAGASPAKMRRTRNAEGTDQGIMLLKLGPHGSLEVQCSGARSRP